MVDKCRITRSRWLKRSVITALFFLIPALCSAESEKNVTTEEIIDILKEKGIITDQEYQDLKKKPIKRKSRKRKSIQ